MSGTNSSRYLTECRSYLDNLSKGDSIGAAKTDELNKVINKVSKIFFIVLKY